MMRWSLTPYSGESRVLATLDKDFGEIAIVRGVPHSGIVRLVSVRAREQGRTLNDILSRYAHDLAAGRAARGDVPRGLVQIGAGRGVWTV